LNRSLQNIGLVYLVFASALVAQETPQFTGIQRLTNREMFLQLNAPAGLDYRIEVSTNLLRWDVLTIGGKRIYLSGDTEDIPEMRALQNIDASENGISNQSTNTNDRKSYEPNNHADRRRDPCSRHLLRSGLGQGPPRKILAPPRVGQSQTRQP